MATELAARRQALGINFYRLCDKAQVSPDVLAQLESSSSAAWQVPQYQREAVFRALSELTGRYFATKEVTDLLRDDLERRVEVGLGRLRDGDAMAYDKFGTPILVQASADPLRDPRRPSRRSAG